MEQNKSLKRVKRQFEEWRKNRASHRERIPQELWNAAVEETAHHTINKVSRTLSLNHTALKNRAMHRSEQKTSVMPVGDFVQIPQSIVLSVMPKEAIRCHRIELQRSDGSRMHLYSRDETGIDAIVLMNAFLGRSQ